MTARRLLLHAATVVLVSTAACSPRVTLEPPKEPIHMIVDVNIKHELYVKIDKDVGEAIDEQGDRF
jgi:hypothetical protein